MATLHIVCMYIGMNVCMYYDRSCDSRLFSCACFLVADYLSGLFNQLYLNPEKNPATDAWRFEHEQGN